MAVATKNPKPGPCQKRGTISNSRFTLKYFACFTVPKIVPRTFRNALANSDIYRHMKNLKGLDAQRIARNI